MNKHFVRRIDIAVFALPALILFTVFVIYPLIPQLLISFQDHNGFVSHGYVGFENYIETFTSKAFLLSVKNTYLIVFMSVCIAIPISLLLALLMDILGENERRYFKLSSVMPALLSVTVIAQMWIAIYEPNWGLVNNLLEQLGLENLTRTWLGEKETVVICIAIAFLWQYIGINALLFYTGIKTIPKSIKEAAVIDGANFLQKSIFVIIPLLRDVGKYVLIVSTLGSMALFPHVRIMTMGGPGSMSRTMIYQLYYKAFSQSEFGQGSAIAIIFVIQSIIVSILINRFVAKDQIEY